MPRMSAFAAALTGTLTVPPCLSAKRYRCIAQRIHENGAFIRPINPPADFTLAAPYCEKDILQERQQLAPFFMPKRRFFAKKRRNLKMRAFKLSKMIDSLLNMCYAELSNLLGK